MGVGVGQTGVVGPPGLAFSRLAWRVASSLAERVGMPAEPPDGLDCPAPAPEEDCPLPEDAGAAVTQAVGVGVKVELLVAGLHAVRIRKASQAAVMIHAAF